MLTTPIWNLYFDFHQLGFLGWSLVVLPGAVDLNFRDQLRYPFPNQSLSMAVFNFSSDSSSSISSFLYL
eukprot:UN02277